MQKEFTRNKRGSKLQKYKIPLTKNIISIITNNKSRGKNKQKTNQKI